MNLHAELADLRQQRADAILAYDRPLLARLDRQISEMTSFIDAVFIFPDLLGANAENAVRRHLTALRLTNPWLAQERTTRAVPFFNNPTTDNLRKIWLS